MNLCMHMDTIRFMGVRLGTTTEGDQVSILLLLETVVTFATMTPQFRTPDPLRNINTELR